MKEAEVTERDDRELCWVPVDELLRQPPFPARDGDPALDFLLSSVRIHGVLSPLLVRDHGGRLQVVCGYRRLLAARAAHLAAVPVLVAKLEDVQAIRCYLSENICRQDLAPRAREDALRLLKRLRDGSELAPDDSQRTGTKPSPTLDSGAGSRVRSTSSPASLEAESEGREAGGGAGAVASPPAQDGARRRMGWAKRRGEFVEEGAREAAADEEIAPVPLARRKAIVGELVKRTRALLEAVQRTKRLDTGRAESIVALLLGLAPELHPLWAEEVYEPEAETWIAEHAILCASFNAALAPPESGPEGRSEYALAGLLHDVGMVFLESKSYLSEPRALNPGQRAEVQTHTRLGHALIMVADPSRVELAHAARDHHERLDGSGYPNGLRGEQLGRLIRVTALVDTYASMIGNRPHRNALSAEAALERLERATEMGLYDPGPVAFLRAFLFPSALVARPAVPAGAVGALESD